MRKARIYMNQVEAGLFEQLDKEWYQFTYYPHYSGEPISLNMPLTTQIYNFNEFPAFFDGLLPEGSMLEALLRKYKIDRTDYFGQLIKVGQDLVGAVTIEELE